MSYQRDVTIDSFLTHVKYYVAHLNFAYTLACLSDQIVLCKLIDFGATALSISTPQPVGVVHCSFSEQDIAFALAWEVHAPGLGGWTVTYDADDDRGEVILVDPPLVSGDGFELRRDSLGVAIRSMLGVHFAPTLRDALLLICPLGRETLAEVERLADAPTG